MDRMTSERPDAAVVTVSDGVTHGTRADASGDLAVRILTEAAFAVPSREVVPDERDRIEEALRRLAGDHDLIVTTGGTGFGPRDVTPEATRAVIDREAPGIAELMRAAGLAATPMAALSRAVVGVLGSTMIVNLPGSPKGVRESLDAALTVVPHAVDLLRGATGQHPTGHGPATPSAADPAIRVEAKAVRLIGQPPCRLGSAMSIVPDGEVHGTLGCAEFDDAAVRAAAEVAEAGEPELRILTHDLGQIEVFFEPVTPAAPAIVVSATDVARALCRYLEALGYEPTLVEPREERVGPSDGPHVRGLDDVVLRSDAVAILTDHDAPDVTDLLATLVRSPVRFVGVMGSKRHVGHYVEELRSRGFTDEELARIRSPLGLDIGGRSPDEIALSIAAGVVADRHGRDGGWLDR